MPKPASKPTSKSKETTKQVPKGRFYITATLNNTLVTFTDENGQTVCWSSTGAVGFKGSRKSTPYASTMAIEAVVSKMKNRGVRQIEVFLKGPGPGRDAALRVLRGTPFKITKIADVTPLPHNGTRPRKQRRV